MMRWLGVCCFAAAAAVPLIMLATFPSWSPLMLRIGYAVTAAFVIAAGYLIALRAF